MEWLGERVTVKVASATAAGPPLVMQAAGTLLAGWDHDEPGYGALGDVVRFGFEEHDATFYVDREFFRGAHTDASGSWLTVDLTTVGLEVTSS